jgi:hypothetical protein
MSNEDYHELLEQLGDKTRDLCRGILSLMEELEAEDGYYQRVDTCSAKRLKAFLAHNRDEEKEHAAMVLGWNPCQNPGFGKELTEYLFTDKQLTHDQGCKNL